jgi:anti-anti-sigma factor
MRSTCRRHGRGVLLFGAKNKGPIVSFGLGRMNSNRLRTSTKRPGLMPEHKRIKVSDSAGVTVVTFADSKIIDEDEIQELGQELYDLVERENHRKFVLNFSHVEFLSSAALGKLISFEKKVSTHDGELILTNIRPEIYEVFAITKLTKLFQIKDDEADALAVL